MRIGVLAPAGLWLLHGGKKALVAAAEESGGKQRQLTHTPTWAVAAVCSVLIIISLLLEKILHRVATWLWEKHKRALLEALEKVKSELMVLGFISLLLTFGESYILKICIPEKAANTMQPCPAVHDTHKEEESRRRLLWADRRFLAGDASASHCKKGFEPLISVEGLHQLHLLLFFLAVVHVLYSFGTMMLGRLKIRRWKGWERETLSHDYEFSTDPSRFRLTHETSFVRAHTSCWTKVPFFFYIGCFFRQFFRSVRKTDYLTLRHGFIVLHLAPGSKFDFQKYIKRSLEDDFKVVVGISPVLWASFVIFLLLNVDGWRTLFWSSALPVIIILAVGTKLQAILTKMAIEIMDRHAVVQGIPLVQGSDRYFWFSHPRLLLHLVHFALFQNAFQITYSFWIWYSRSCFHNNLRLLLIKVGVGMGAVLLCSYITLPLYALVTQMGSHMKRSVFDEQTSKALKRWHMAVKKKKAKAKAGKLPTKTLGGAGSMSATTTGSTIHSSGRSLQRYKTIGHSTNSYTYDDQDASDLEADPLSPASSQPSFMAGQEERAIEISQIYHEGETSNEDDFSFAKPVPVKERE